MTAVFVPYTFRHQPTWEALRDSGWEWYPVELAAGDDTSYLHFFEYRWRVGSDFIVCEHDVIPTVEQLQQLEDCPAEWCSFNEYDAGPPTLSLARFRSSFIAGHRDLWRQLWAANRKTVFQPLWCKLDSWLTDCCGQPCLHQSPHVVNSRPLGVTH